MEKRDLTRIVKDGIVYSVPDVRPKPLPYFSENEFVCHTFLQTLNEYKMFVSNELIPMIEKYCDIYNTFEFSTIYLLYSRNVKMYVHDVKFSGKTITDLSFCFKDDEDTWGYEFRWNNGQFDDLEEYGVVPKDFTLENSKGYINGECFLPVLQEFIKYFWVGDTVSSTGNIEIVEVPVNIVSKLYHGEKLTLNELSYFDTEYKIYNMSNVFMTPYSYIDDVLQFYTDVESYSRNSISINLKTGETSCEIENELYSTVDGIDKRLTEDLNNIRADLTNRIDGLTHITTEVVEDESFVTEPNVIYLIKKDVAGPDQYETWIYTESDGPLLIGDTSVDLSGYAKSDDLKSCVKSVYVEGAGGTNQIIYGTIIYYFVKRQEPGVFVTNDKYIVTVVYVHAGPNKLYEVSILDIPTHAIYKSIAYDPNTISHDVTTIKYETIIKPADTTYTNSTPIPTAIGGIAKGTTFDNKTVQEVLDMLLYPYVAFSFTVSTEPAAGVYEKGTSITLSKVNVNITKGSADVTKIYIKDSDNTTHAMVTSNIAQSGNNAITVRKVITKNTVVTVELTDSESNTESTTLSYSFVDPYYYGVIADGVDITASVITGLTKDVKAKGNKAYTFNMSNQKALLAYPKSYGLLTLIKDANNFDVTNTFNVHAVSVNSVDYYVYVLSNTATSNMKFTFNY